MVSLHVVPDDPAPAPEAEHADGVPLRPWLDHLIQNIELARLGADPEGTHQLRIAVARLRVWLRLGGWRVLEDDLQWLRNRAAQVRDLDVHLAHRPPPVVAAHLTTERAIAQGDLVRALDHPRLAALLSALALLPPLDRNRARRQTARLAREALRRGKRAKARPDDLAALHALRRAVRRVRFAMEWLGTCPRRVHELLDTLGDAGDRIVALRQLEGVDVEGVRLAPYRVRLHAALQKKLHRAMKQWSDSREVVEDVARWKSS